MFPLEDLFEDEETQRLTREYPVRETLGRHYDFWKSEEVTADHSHGFFLNSPAQDVIAERTVLGFLLQAAAQNDRWMGFKSGAQIESVDEYATQVHAARTSNEHARALSKSLEHGMIRFGQTGWHLGILPTETYAKFVQERARR